MSLATTTPKFGTLSLPLMTEFLIEIWQLVKKSCAFLVGKSSIQSDIKMLIDRLIVKW